MEIKKTQTGDACFLSLTGRLDTVTAPNLQEILVGVLQSSENI